MAEENSTSTELPETIGIHEAAELMTKMGMGLDDTVAPNAQPEGNAVAPEAAPAENVSEDAPDGGAEEDPDGLEAAEGDGQGEDPTLNEAPEFWSAEDKAAWNTVPPALRPMLKKIDSERVAFVNQQKAEAAKIRQEALEEVKQATSVVEQGAKWWTDNGPQFFKAFGDKWAQVNWVELSEKDPAECQRLTILRDQEAALLRQAHEKGQRDIEAANKRVAAQIDELKRTEHEKVAAKLPEYFGTIEKATQTYKDLSEYLFSKGIPAERISQIHEAPIIEMALNSMRFERAQKQASTVVTRDAATGKFTAKTAPTRVQPGPATRQGAGDRNVEQARRVGERFRKTEGADIRDMAELIRLNGL
jgi:hypothetical protein